MIQPKSLNALLILLLTGLSTIAQQSNSKIMTLLKKQFKTDSLYIQSLPTMLERFEKNVVSKENNVDLSLGNESRYRFSDNRINFEVGIKVIAKDILLFNKYLPDTISFYFNDNKLNKCVWHFSIKNNENEVISKVLAQQLGNPSGQNWGGPSWSDKSMKLNLILDNIAMETYNQKSQNKFRSVMYGEEIKTFNYDKGAFTLEFEMFESQKTIEKPQTKHEVLESAIKNDRDGKGNGTFSLNLLKLESIIKSNTTLKQLESQLGIWKSYGVDNHLGYEWDKKTNDYTIPLFQVQYATTVKNRYFTLLTEVTPILSSRIKYLEVITVLNGMQLAEFKQSLANANYLVNENLTEIFKKQTWQNKAKKLMVTIKANANGTYSIGIR